MAKTKTGGASTEQKTKYKNTGETNDALRELPIGRRIPYLDGHAFNYDHHSVLNNAVGVVEAMFTDKDGNRTLHQYQGQLYKFQANTHEWLPMPSEVLHRGVWDLLDREAKTFSADETTGLLKEERIKINLRLVNEIITAMRGLLFLNTQGYPLPITVKGILPLENRVVGRRKTVSITTGQSEDTSPAVFTLNTLPFDLDLDAEPPERWLQFLDEVFPGDPDAIKLLQEWIGYIVSGRTDMQKAMFIVGPKRSGKGTICNVIKELVGPRNYGASSLVQIAGRFGLAGLIDKSIAVMSDVRVDTKHKLGAATTERILTVTGEDTIAVERKGIDDVHVKLGVRLMMTTNELPPFDDISGALVSRLLTLEMRESFYGKEDTELLADLRAELPGIMRWAVEGLKRLDHRGCFTEPESGRGAREQLSLAGSPVRAWLDECCELDPNAETATESVRASYVNWCSLNGITPVQPTTFGKDLKAATGGAVERKGRDGNTRRVYVGLRLNEQHS